MPACPVGHIALMCIICIVTTEIAWGAEGPGWVEDAHIRNNVGSEVSCKTGLQEPGGATHIVTRIISMYVPLF
jgi:hypothetical protein